MNSFRMSRRIMMGGLLMLGVSMAGSQLHCDNDSGGQAAVDMAQPAEPADLSMPPDLMQAAPSLRVIAGEVGGIGTVDGTGTNARFARPNGITADNAGNVYVLDTGNFTLRKVVAASGEVTTLAGMPGSLASTDGTGAAARFSRPLGVTMDGAGNIYVGDTFGRVVRKVVVATGVVTTLAGTANMLGSTDGTGAAARFNAPTGVAIDGAGNLYVTDTSTIRKVVVATGVVTTLAGTAGTSGSADGTGAAARFNGHFGLAIDGAGNLYVADANNNTIRKVVVATGVVTTLVGTAGMAGSTDGTGAAARFNKPSGVAVDGAGNLYVADTDNSTIRKVVVATGVVTTLVGTAGMSGSTDGMGSSARFNRPIGLTVDGAGNLYVADPLNDNTRKVVVATGVVTTLAGAPSMTGSTDGTGRVARFSNLNGAALDGAGNLYVLDNNTIRKVAVGTGAVSTLAGTSGVTGSADGTGAAARFSLPLNLAADGAGNLYVADYDNQTIRKVVAATGAVSTLVGTAGMRGITDGTGAAARFSGPAGVAVDGAGNLYVAEYDSNIIRKVVLATGAVSTLAGTGNMRGNTDGTGAAARFNGPWSVTTDSAGNLYVAEYDGHTIRKVVGATGVVTTLAGTAGMRGSTDGTGTTAGFSGPRGVAFDGAGNLYVADTENGTLRKVVLGNASVSTIIGRAGQLGVSPGMLSARLNGPAGLAISPSGEIFLTDTNEHVVLGWR